MPEIALENLSVHYARVEAVRDVSLTVRDREYCVLLGPSGCGKTSILRAIAGFVSPAGGDVRIGGQSVVRLYPGDRDVAMIFQNYALYPHLTVRGNFAFPLQAQRLPAQEADAKVVEIAQLLHMTHLLDRYPRELSGGEQQRVALGRALVRRCPTLLLDEPLGNLDAKLRVEMRASLKQLQRQLGITAIHVTHDQTEALALADRIVVMNDGQVLQIGTPDEIYDRPANRFVAQFVGTPAMNLLRCRVVRRDDAIFLQGEDMAIQAPPSEASALAKRVGEEADVGVRPEHVRLCEFDERCEAAGVVVVTEPQGNELIVDLQVGERLLRARAPREQIGAFARPEAKVGVSFPPERLHIFDAETERRIEAGAEAD
jgi:multiple sugar transport system ATP-binding protein